MSDETVETDRELSSEEKATMDVVRKERLLHIFTELYKSKRFAEFVEKNFDVVDEINDVEKSITTLVIEKPMAVGPQMSAKQIAKLHQIITASGTEKVGETLSKILETLGQDDSGLIVESILDPSTLKLPQ